MENSFWTYQIVHHKDVVLDDDGGEHPTEWYDIHEAFYDNGVLIGVTDEAIAAVGETPQELASDLASMIQDAMTHAVLEEKDIPTLGQWLPKEVREEFGLDN